MNRLECIKSMVSKCSVAADIGTDHGYLVEMLLKENICDFAIATDLNQGPLQRAIEYLTDVNLAKNCSFRLGSGLTVLNEKEADAIIIAGMGGELIKEILDKSKNISKITPQLILQPMTKSECLRSYLYENNFEIIDENIVKELHHYYFIIKVIPKTNIKKTEDEIFYEFSKVLVEKKDPLMLEYMKKQITINENIIRSIEKNTNKSYNRKIKELKNKNEKIKELMKY